MVQSPDSRPLHALEIKQRPRKTWAQFALGILFLFTFELGLCMIHATQVFFVLPLKIVPGEWSRNAYDDGVRMSKGALGKLTRKSGHFCCFVYEVHIDIVIC